jgi:hypothetical protein
MPVGAGTGGTDELSVESGGRVEDCPLSVGKGGKPEAVLSPEAPAGTGGNELVELAEELSPVIGGNTTPDPEEAELSPGNGGRADEGAKDD